MSSKKKLDNWLATYFQDDKFFINEPKNNSNGLFKIIEKSAKNISIVDQREILSSKITSEIYDNLNIYYTDLGKRILDKSLSEPDKIYLESILLDFEFLEDVSNYIELQNYIKTPEFWPNYWSIFTLEQELKFKILILNSRNKDSANPEDLVLCGPDLSTINSEKIQVDKFIIVSVDNHIYSLITYDGKSSFTKDTLPPQIIALFSKCFKNNSNFTRIE